MDMREFVSGCRDCNPRADPVRAAELLKAAAELGEAILKNREKNSAVPYQQIIDTYNQNCGSLPKATKLTDKRKRAVGMFRCRSAGGLPQGGFNAVPNRSERARLAC